MIRPNLFTFGRAIWRAVRALFRLEPILAPPPVQNRRLAECYTCEHLDDAEDQCQLCTCFVMAKTALATEECPDGRWDAWAPPKRSGRK
jgi:hypothetical protein